MARRQHLSPQAERFVILYMAGPDDMRGNGTRCYLEAYPNTTSEKVAGSLASRLLKRDSVRTRMRQLRDEAEESARNRLRSWMELAPKAQDVLEQAMDGSLSGSDEQIRSAVNAAKETLDRALGSVKHMHDTESGGPVVNVFVAAGIPHDQQAVSVEEVEAVTSGPRLLGTG